MVHLSAATEDTGTKDERIHELKRVAETDKQLKDKENTVFSSVTDSLAPEVFTFQM